MSRKYYIYTLTDPRTNGIYYVGQTVNIVQRKSAHLRKHDRTSAKNRCAEIVAAGYEPIFSVVDEIVTCDWFYAIRLEACWRSKLLQQGCNLVNIRKTGSVYKEIAQPDKEIIAVKKYADSAWAEYENMLVKQSMNAQVFINVNQ